MIMLKENNPDIIEFLVDKNNQDKAITSKKYIEVKCPCCGKIHSDTVRTIACRDHTYCNICYDGYSYPERLFSSVLEKLNIPYVFHYKSDWTKRYEYDFMFEINYVKYIVEMDGGLGHGRTGKYNYNSKEKMLERDKTKDDLARQNGFNIIRIDCDYNNEINKLEFIKK